MRPADEEGRRDDGQHDAEDPDRGPRAGLIERRVLGGDEVAPRGEVVEEDGHGLGEDRGRGHGGEEEVPVADCPVQAGERITRRRYEDGAFCALRGDGEHQVGAHE